jgi:site-specific DNA-methyltransferase (adenine-specific)
MTQPYSLHIGDCLDVLKSLDAESIDAIVTDPPYGLAFMGKKWDYDVPSTDIWQECLRVLKPGGHLLAFAGTRTQHRMAVRIEDAGFEIRDMIAWVYGSGFPKSLDVSKAINKAAGAEREVVGTKDNKGRCAGNIACIGLNTNKDGDPITAPATPEAQQWAGWGTALKPALEPITLARKPLIGTVAENVLEYGTGALNIDGCRVEGENWVKTPAKSDSGLGGGYLGGKKPILRESNHIGRWPANFIHDGSDEVTDLVGSAARFFYCPKASKAEREAGLDGMEENPAGSLNMRIDAHAIKNGMNTEPQRNHHPTVKPIDLMAYLCRLITPPNGTILDPFTGSGSTGVAALREGFKFIGIELNAEYAEIAQKRIENELNKAPLFTNA